MAEAFRVSPWNSLVIVSVQLLASLRSLRLLAALRITVSVLCLGLFFLLRLMNSSCKYICIYKYFVYTKHIHVLAVM